MYTVYRTITNEVLLEIPSRLISISRTCELNRPFYIKLSGHSSCLGHDFRLGAFLHLQGEDGT